MDLVQKKGHLLSVVVTNCFSSTNCALILLLPPEEHGRWCVYPFAPVQRVVSSRWSMLAAAGSRIPDGCISSPWCTGCGVAVRRACNCW